MLLTNHYNLPDVICQAVSANIQKPQPDVLRVSEIINPPIIKNLTLKFWDTLETDCSESLWSLLGTSVHAEIAKISNNALVEIRINVPVCGIMLSGMVDRYEIDMQTICDIKCTSVWSYLLGVKEDWVRQLNLYKYLLEQEGHPVQILKIYAILRDHQISKAVQQNYPKVPFQTINIPVWSPDKVNSYIRERVNVHQSDPLPCSPAERWQRDSTFAIMKTGRKSAVRVLDTEDEAIVYLSGNKIKEVDKKKCEIVKRVGEAIKCKSYCSVRDVCEHNFYKKENKTCV